MKTLIPVEMIERKIFLIRGQKVMLDKDLAALYGVKPIRLERTGKKKPGALP